MSLRNSGARQPVVVDTNVMLAANGADKEWLPIRAACAERLSAIKSGSRVCVDSLYLILGEYGHKLPSRSRSGDGDMFYLWVAQNLKNPELCEQVQITPLNADRTQFEEFPAIDPTVLALVDHSDKKFISVAHAHTAKPPIVEATDSKWIGWRDGLAAVGLTVEFIDEQFLRAIYIRKMGRQG